MQDWSCSPQLASHLIPGQVNEELTPRGGLILDAQCPLPKKWLTPMSQFRAPFIWSQLTAVRRQNCASLWHWKVSAHPMSISNCLFFHSLTAYQYLQSGRQGVAFPATISPAPSEAKARLLFLWRPSPPLPGTGGRAWKRKVRTMCVSVEEDRMNTGKYQPLRSEGPTTLWS